MHTPDELEASYKNRNYQEWQVEKKVSGYHDPSPERNKINCPLVVSRENGKVKEILDKFIDKGLFMSTINENYIINAM